MGRPRDEIWEEVTKLENRRWKCNRCKLDYAGGVKKIKVHLGIIKEKGIIALCNGVSTSSVPINEEENIFATAGSSDPMQVQVSGGATYEVNESLNHQNYTGPIHTSQVSGGAAHVMNESLNHQNYTGPIHTSQVSGGAAHEVNESLNHQNYIGHIHTSQVSGGAAYEVNESLNHQNYTGLIHTSQGLVNVDDAVGNENDGFQSEISQIKELIGKLASEEGKIRKELQWLESLTGQTWESRTEVFYWLDGANELEERANNLIEDSSRQDRLDRSELKDLIQEVHTHIKGKPFVLPNEFVNDKGLGLPFGLDFGFGFGFGDNLRMLRDLVRDDKVLLIGVHGMGGVGKTTLVTHFKKGKNEYTKNVIWVTVSQDFSIFKLQSAIAKRIGIKLDDDDEIVERARNLSLALDKKGKLVLILDDVWNYIDLQKVGIPLRVNGIKLILTSRLKHVVQQMDCPPECMIQMETLYHDFECDVDESWVFFLLKLGYYGTPATLTPEIENIAKSIVKRCDGLPLGISVMARIMKGANDIRQWRHALNKLENLSMGGEMEDEVFKSLKLSYDHLRDENIQSCFLMCSLYTDIPEDIADIISENELIMKLVDEGLIKEMKSLEEIFDEGHAILDQLKGHSLLVESWIQIGVRGVIMNGLVRDMASYVMKGRYKYKSMTKVPDEQEWSHDLEKAFLVGDDIEEIPEGTSPKCPLLSVLILKYTDLSQIPYCFFSRMNVLTILDLSYSEKLTSLPNSLSILKSLKSLLLRECHSLEYVPPLKDLLNLTRLVISGTSIERVPEGLAKLVKLRWLDLSNNDHLTFEPGSVLFNLINLQYLDLRSSQVTVEVNNVKEMSVLECVAVRFNAINDFADYVENILDRGIGPKYYYLYYGIHSIGKFKIPYELLEKDGWPNYVCFGDCEAFNFLLPRDLHGLCISYVRQWSKTICDVLRGPSSLRKITVSDCPKLESLFCLTGSHSLLQFPKLEKIIVKNCESMKEIFATRSSDDDNDDNDDNDDDVSTITLSNSFKLLKIHNLPHLETVCASIIVCKSPPKLDVYNCPNITEDSVRYKSSLFDPNIVILKIVDDVFSLSSDNLDI